MTKREEVLQYGMTLENVYNVLARKPMVFRPWDEWR